MTRPTAVRGRSSDCPPRNRCPRRRPEQSEILVLLRATDGRAFLYRPDKATAEVFLVDERTGERVLRKELAPPDRVGVRSISGVAVNPKGTAYAYSYSRYLSELYVLEGLR